MIILATVFMILVNQCKIFITQEGIIYFYHSKAKGSWLYAINSPQQTEVDPMTLLGFRVKRGLNV